MKNYVIETGWFDEDYDAEPIGGEDEQTIKIQSVG